MSLLTRRALIVGGTSALVATPATIKAASLRPIRGLVICIPGVIESAGAAQAPAGSQHDGFRMIVRRNGVRVRLFTRRGNDCSDPPCDETARNLQ